MEHNKLFLSNTFSFNMIDTDEGSFDLLVDEIRPSSVRIDLDSWKGNVAINIGNTATMALFNAMCETDFKPSKVDISMSPGDCMIVMQYNGPKLEGDLKAVPEGGNLRFYYVEMVKTITEDR